MAAPSGVQYEHRPRAAPRRRHRGRAPRCAPTPSTALRSWTASTQPRMCDAGRGQVLAPWPNRLGDGRYSFDGRDAQAALDEPEHHNAIHGLVRWLPWQVVSRAQNVLALRCVLHPQPGYPWRLELVVEYRLGARRPQRERHVPPTSTPRRRPSGSASTPTSRWADGGRPRLAGGAGPSSSRDRRTGPPHHQPVGGRVRARLHRRRRWVGATRLDTAFTDLVRDGDGMARVELDDSAGGRGVTVWMDERFRYVMVFTGDTLEPDRRRRALAIEPMTCPPDALRYGDDVVRLEPGAAWSGPLGHHPPLNVERHRGRRPGSGAVSWGGMMRRSTSLGGAGPAEQIALGEGAAQLAPGGRAGLLVRCPRLPP